MSAEERGEEHARFPAPDPRTLLVGLPVPDLSTLPESLAAVVYAVRTVEAQAQAMRECGGGDMAAAAARNLDRFALQLRGLYSLLTYRVVPFLEWAQEHCQGRDAGVSVFRLVAQDLLDHEDILRQVYAQATKHYGRELHEFEAVGTRAMRCKWCQFNEYHAVHTLAVAFGTQLARASAGAYDSARPERSTTPR